MLLLSRAITLVLLLATIPQAPRTALGRCTIGRQPAASYVLPGRLAEVSGLAIGPGGNLLAHGDERGVIEVFDPATLKLVRNVQLTGTPRDDFEGIAAAGDSVALMTSSGKVYLFRLGQDSIVSFTTIATGLGKECELEGLGWHRARATLFLPCKQPRGRAVSGLTVYRYRLGSNPALLPPIHVTGGALSQATRVSMLRATAIEIDPSTGNLVVLSSKPPLLLEADTTGRILGVRQLASRSHPQAEGLTLSRDALWIADEGAGRKGMLALYACQ